MTGGDGRQNRPDRLIRGVIILAAFLLLPVFIPAFAWLHTLVPLPVIFLFADSGRRQAIRTVKTALLVAGGIAVVTGSLPGLLISCSMLPLGFYLAHSMGGRENFIRTAATGIVVLLACWAVLAVMYGVLYHLNPYAETIKALELAISATYDSYKEAANLSLDTLAELERAFAMMRQYVPIVMPAVFVMSSISAVWINLAAGNALLRKKDIDLVPWPEFNSWRLPEHLVWLVIASGVGILLPDSLLQHVSINTFLIMGTIYFFQGLAVLVSLFARWSIPRPFRIAIYAFILIQVYGFIFLAIAGLADVWIDFRKERPRAT